MGKKKILHIVESFGSGVFSFLVDLINCTDQEFDIIVAYGVRKETPENFKDYFSDKVKFIEVKNFTRSISPIKDLKALKEIKQIIKQEDPNIIHLHSSKAGIIGRFAANGKKVKMLYNPHGFSFLMKNSSKIKRFIYWLIEKISATFKRRCTIVGCSEGEYEEAKKLSKNAICINNGVSIQKLESDIKDIEQKQIDIENIKICTSGRIGFQKNPKLFNELAQRFPNIEFTWIGDGEQREDLTSSNIKVTGWLTRKEVLKQVANNDIFILPSLWEGLPLSLLEAMYLKKICIVSNVIGNRDVIKDNENGFICNQIDDFERVINEIQQNKYDLQELAKKAQVDVIENFSIDLMVQKYKEEYKK